MPLHQQIIGRNFPIVLMQENVSEGRTCAPEEDIERILEVYDQINEEDSWTV